MRITKEQLIEWDACDRAQELFLERFPDGEADYQAVLDALAADDWPNWAHWLMDRAGPDSTMLEVESISGKHFFYAGSIRVARNIIIRGSIVVGGAIEAGESIEAGGNLDVGGNLTVGEPVTTSEAVGYMLAPGFVADSVRVARNIIIRGTMRVGGTITVRGTSTAGCRGGGGTGA